MNTLLKNAKILTMIGDQIIDGDILITDNKISQIGKNISCENIDKVIDCEGNILMPSFKNAHAHNAMVFLRSAADDLPLNDWLFNVVFPAEAKFQDGDIYALTKLGICESIASGITASMDMYFHNHEVEKCTNELGFRTLIIGSPDKETTDFLKNDYLSYEQKSKNFIARYIPGIHSEYTATEERLKDLIALQNELQIPTYMHMSETRKEVEDCIKRHGKTPLEYIISLGGFKNGGAIFHGIYLTEKEIELVKKYNITIVVNAGSNSKLASGVCDVKKFFDENINLALGTDGPASNNSINMFKEMYLIAVLQKLLHKDAACLDAKEVLKMATVNGAHAMGLYDCDTLEVGKCADIIMLDINHPSMRPVHNIFKNIVYAGSVDMVKMTMCNGKILYYNKKFIDIDYDNIVKEAEKVTARLLNK